jgi:phosphoribosyl 1,2-cyclic phosphodiesterase
VSVSHDAAEPVAFVVEDGCARAAIVTDLGVTTRPLRYSLDDLDLAVIEANHDLDMLLAGPYPWELKQRIKSNHGHLSNAQARELVAGIVHPRLKRVFLAHLSQQNNLPRLARAEVQAALDGSGCRLGLCRQEEPAALVEI